MFKEKFNREIYSKAERDAKLAENKKDQEYKKAELKTGKKIFDLQLEADQKKNNYDENFFKTLLRDTFGIGKEKWEKAEDDYHDAVEKLNELMRIGHSEAIELNEQFNSLQSRLKIQSEYLEQLPESSPERKQAEKEYSALLSDISLFKRGKLDLIK